MCRWWSTEGRSGERTCCSATYLRTNADAARRYAEAKRLAAGAAPTLLAYSRLKSPTVKQLLREAEARSPGSCRQPRVSGWGCELLHEFGLGEGVTDAHRYNVGLES
jgi:hypothetical protein